MAEKAGGVPIHFNQIQENFKKNICEKYFIILPMNMSGLAYALDL